MTNIFSSLDFLLEADREVDLEASLGHKNLAFFRTANRYTDQRSTDLRWTDMIE